MAVRNPPQSRTICNSGVVNQAGNFSATTIAKPLMANSSAKNPANQPDPNRRTSTGDSRSRISF